VKQLSYANVVASIALFVALGGGAYAAISLPRNSVGAKQIKKNAVNGRKVRNHSLTGADVRASTLGLVREARHASSADEAGNATTAGLAGALAAPAAPSLAPVRIAGGGFPSSNGLVSSDPGVAMISLDGITFRAAS